MQFWALRRTASNSILAVPWQLLYYRSSTSSFPLSPSPWSFAFGIESSSSLLASLFEFPCLASSPYIRGCWSHSVFTRVEFLLYVSVQLYAVVTKNHTMPTLEGGFLFFSSFLYILLYFLIPRCSLLLNFPKSFFRILLIKKQEYTRIPLN